MSPHRTPCFATAGLLASPEVREVTELEVRCFTRALELLFIPAEEAAPLHVQVGALSVSTARLFDWLDEHI